MPLYSPHSAALTTLFADVETFALSQREVFTGTAGSVLRRRNAANFEFYAHQSYDALGVKRERYVAGPVGAPSAEVAADALRSRIADTKRATESIRLLGREGFQLVDARSFATMAALQNHGLFTGGAILIGSHAYGALVNRLGVRAISYVTEDIDVARGTPIAFPGRQREALRDMLLGSGIDFVEVPALDSRGPSTAFGQRGRSSFQIQLLSPARGEQIGTAAVPELDAHATAVPFLAYVLRESNMTAILAREGCVAVRVPTPERFAIHKFIVSDLRRGRDAKVRKDRQQAAVLAAALGDLYPGALETAIRAVPRSASRHLKRSLSQVRAVLETAHPGAWEELSKAL